MFSLLAPLLLALHADQAAWITPAQARRGADLVRQAGRVAWFCEPCDDPVCREEPVRTVAATPVDAGYHQVVVNGEESDLAYLFVPKDGKWANVALLMKLPVHHVSRTLPLSRCTPDNSTPAISSTPTPTPQLSPSNGDGAFTLRSPGAYRFGEILLEAWTSRTQSRTTSTIRLDARILPQPQVYWSIGNTVVLRRGDERDPHAPYHLLELELQPSGQPGSQALCDAQACTFDGDYEILDCHERAKGIQSCRLRKLSEAVAPSPASSTEPQSGPQDEGQWE